MNPNSFVIGVMKNKFHYSLPNTIRNSSLRDRYLLYRDAKRTIASFRLKRKK